MYTLSQNMTTLRAFVAIELPDPLQTGLAAVISTLQKSSPPVVRWVPAENIHLTLKFLGNISTASLNDLQRTLQASVKGLRPFEVQVAGVGAFPKLRTPRVIWSALNAPDALTHLAQIVDAAALKLGYPQEERPFSPHLTLGRVSDKANAQEVSALADNLAKQGNISLGSFTVRDIQLFRSDLKPTGSVYTSLFSAPLGA